MIINNKTGQIAYHALRLTESGLQFIQYDYDGKETERPLTEDERFVSPSLGKRI